MCTDARNRRKSGHHRTVKVRTSEVSSGAEVWVSGFSSRRDGMSRVTGGIGATRRTTTPSHRVTYTSGAPSAKPRKGNRGDKLRMGWRDESHGVDAARNGVILDGTSASRVDNLDCFLTSE